MCAKRQRARLLVMNDPLAMRINADLAEEIGLNESIVLLQLEFLISISEHEHDGKLWTYQSLSDLKTYYFKWWSVPTISRIIKSLEQRGLIHVRNDLNKLGYDRTQWYALNAENINILHSVAIFQNEKCNTPQQDAIFQNEKSIFQSDRMEAIKMKNGSDQLETTIPETTTETTTEKGRGRKRTARPRDLLFEALAEACEIDWTICTDDQRHQLNQTSSMLRTAGEKKEQTEAQIIEAARYVAGYIRKYVWPFNGENGATARPPAPADIRKHWKQAINARNKQSDNGTYAEIERRRAHSAKALSPEDLARKARELDAQMQQEAQHG